jgi:uncharacterized protein (DUF427 family)
MAIAALSNESRTQASRTMPNPSPGHRQMPEHKVAEHKVAQRMTVSVGDDLVAESADVIRVDEDRMPPRFYFPRADVRMNLLRASAKTTVCPFKGQASYFSLDLGGGKDQLPDAAWSYDSPYDEHRDLAGRLAFYDDTYPQIRVQQVG